MGVRFFFCQVKKEEEGKCARCVRVEMAKHEQQKHQVFCKLEYGTPKRRAVAPRKKCRLSDRLQPKCGVSSSCILHLFIRIAFRQWFSDLDSTLLRVYITAREQKRTVEPTQKKSWPPPKTKEEKKKEKKHLKRSKKKGGNRT